MQMLHLISGRRLLNGIADVKLKAAGKPVEGQVDHGRGVKRQQLADKQAANDGNAERPTQLRADAGAQSKRQAAEQRGHGGHHDGPEAQQAGFVDGVDRRLAFLALGLEGEVNHHDGVFLDDADEQDDANEGHDPKLRVAQKKSKDGANARRRKRGQDRDGMDVAFVQNAENDVNGDDRSKNQDWLIRKRPEEGRRGPLKRALNAGWHVQFLLRAVDGVNRIAQRCAWSEVEGERHDGKLALVVPSERRIPGVEMREGTERDLRAVGGFDVKVFQRVRILLELRIDFQDHVILIQLREDGGDLALAVGIVKRVVDVRRKNSQARSGVSVNRERGQQALV